MASTIAILDEALVDKIAAGEVIERPANVVKELIDNAIDAGASSIQVRIEDGGRSKIEVTDDGCGMSEEDAKMSVRRYATSKLRVFDDLHQLETLGFRGEALPSIAAVSDLELTTRRREDLAGTRVRVNAGASADVGPCGCAAGTSVLVRNLFEHVPARLKFLRARQTEAAAAYEVCLRAALIQPSVLFTVANEQRTVREYLPVATLSTRAAQAFDEVPLTETTGSRNGVRVHAMLGPAELARRGARQLFLYVNGRPVQERRLARAVALSFGQQLAPGFFPQGVVAIEIDPTLVDVNAHPQKAEVRFAKASSVFDAVTKILAQRRPGGVQSYWEERLGPPGPRLSAAPLAMAQPAGPVRTAQTETPYGRHAGLRVVGRAAEGRFLIVERDKEVLVISRPAGVRRLIGRAFQRSVADAAVKPQQCLFPERVELDEDTMNLLERSQATLASLGFELSILGPNTIAIRTVPALLSGGSPAGLVDTAIHALRSGASEHDIAQRLVDAALTSCLAMVSDSELLDAVAEERECQSTDGESLIAASWSFTDDELQ